MLARRRPAFFVNDRRVVPVIHRRPRVTIAAKRRAILSAQGRLSSPEIKALDSPLAAAAPYTVVVSTTPTFQCLNLLQLGSGFHNRIGNKVIMKSLQVYGQLVESGGSSVTGLQGLRFMIVYDRQPNGAAPAITDLLQDVDNAGTAYTNSLSKINLNYRERFLIIRDRKLYFPAKAGAAVSNIYDAIGTQHQNNDGMWNEFIKLSGLDTKFKGSTNPGAIADIATGALWFITFGNEAVGTAPFAWLGQFRLRYGDA